MPPLPPGSWRFLNPWQLSQQHLEQLAEHQLAHSVAMLGTWGTSCLPAQAQAQHTGAQPAAKRATAEEHLAHTVARLPLRIVIFLIPGIN